ncbi:uncharacterized protein trdc [Pseudorasbora parva]|uniref:uncharacterized protein trdc n=1 Tax=Pseudorasbora parva TaxID=51549 RepID=UPI00351DB27E
MNEDDESPNVMNVIEHGLHQPTANTNANRRSSIPASELLRENGGLGSCWNQTITLDRYEPPNIDQKSWSPTNTKACGPSSSSPSSCEISSGPECFCKAYGSSGFSATDTLTFGKPITLTVSPKDETPSAPAMSILSSLSDKKQDVCVAAGFYPRDKQMVLTPEGKAPETLNTSGAALLLSSRSYYYAGFSGGQLKACSVDEQRVDKATDAPQAEEKPPMPPIQPTCPTNSSAPGSVASDDPKMKSMNLLVTGLRVLLAKCVAVNVLMTVKAFLF